MVSKQEAKPPYVQFSYVPIEDRDASIAKGCPVYKDVAYATVTSAGSKDNVVRPVEDWFALLRKEVQQERFPADWLAHYEKAFEHFRKGEELPVNGTPIKTWPAITPSQVKMLTEMHVLTVEQLAEANEQVIGAIGMGGRALKQKAVDFLASASDHGKVAMELETVRRDLAEALASKSDMTAQIVAQQKQLDALAATIQQMGEGQKASTEPVGAAAKKS